MVGVIPPDDLPRSPTGRVPQWVQDEIAGRAAADTAWRAPSGRFGEGEMPAGWGPALPGRLGRSGGRRARARRRLGPAVTVLSALVMLGGLWWSWSPENRQAAREVLAEMRASGGVAGASPRMAADGSRLPPAGLEEASSRIAPVVVPDLFSEQYVFKSPSASPASPYGWSPCRPIRYVVDPTGAPAGFGETVRASIAEIGAVTGLTFTDDGDVVEAAVEDRPAHLPELYGDRWAPVLIRFADDVSVPRLAGDTVGLASSTGITSRATAVTHYVSGTVYLDVDLLGMPGLGGVPAYLPVLRHELGHLVGLDHVDDPTQLMYPTTGYVYTFQAGDLTGLSLLGQAPCAPDL